MYTCVICLYKNDCTNARSNEERIFDPRDRESADEWPLAANVGVIIQVLQSEINPGFFSFIQYACVTECRQINGHAFGNRAPHQTLPAEDKDTHVRIVSPSRSEKSSRKLSPIIAVPRN